MTDKYKGLSIWEEIWLYSGWIGVIVYFLTKLNFLYESKLFSAIGFAGVLLSFAWTIYIYRIKKLEILFKI